MTRALLALVCLGALAGCTSTTRVVDRTDAASVAAAHSALRGRHAEVHLASGERSSGRIQFVRVDSTAWEGAFRRAVLTAGVASIETTSGGRAVRRGALIGAGVGLGFAALAALYPQDLDETAGAEFALYVGLATVPLGAVFGAVSGAGNVRRVEHVFADGPPGAAE